MRIIKSVISAIEQGKSEFIRLLGISVRLIRLDGIVNFRRLEKAISYVLIMRVPIVLRWRQLQ